MLPGLRTRSSCGGISYTLIPRHDERITNYFYACDVLFINDFPHNFLKPFYAYILARWGLFFEKIVEALFGFREDFYSLSLESRSFFKSLSA